MNALEQIQTAFPRSADQTNEALTGSIPINVFNATEAQIRPLMREAGLRAIYRGPRVESNSSMTRRADATAVLFYNKSVPITI